MTQKAKDSCAICGSTAWETKLAAPDRRLGKNEVYTVRSCARCGTGRTYPPLTTQTLAAAYPSDYRPYSASSRPARGFRRSMSAAMLAAMGYGQKETIPLPPAIARWLAAIRCWTWCPPPPPPGKLLDAGCGSGAYGASLIRLGWRVDGIEVDRNAAGRASEKGLSVQNCGILEADLSLESYDVITLWHVLEHLEDPVAALKHLCKALRPSGILVAEVPNWQGLPARLTGSYWFHLDLPRHRLHFTPRSLLASLSQAGFETRRLIHIPNSHGISGAMGYRFGGQRLHWSAPVQMLGWLAGITAAVLNRSDVIRIVATPADEKE